MIPQKLTGVFTALVTPFKSGEVDYSSLKRLLTYQMDQGIDGFVINGTTAESPTLHWKEAQEIFKFCKSEVDGQVPLMLGTGSNSTEETISKSKQGCDWGADALLVVTPYYNKPSQRGLLAHFKKVADESSAPIILYNIPSRSVISIELSTLLELAQHQNIVGVKDATGDIGFGVETIKSCSEFIVSSGDDLTCFELMARGGHGVVSVISHLIPKAVVDLNRSVKSAEEETLKEAERLQPLMKSIYIAPNPVPVKYALFRMGLIDSDEVRLPLCSMTESLKKQLEKELQKEGLL